jgi:hypothetical protein
MLIEFETYPDGTPVTINTRQVSTVIPAPENPELTVVRFSGGSEVVVRGATVEVAARLGQSGEMRAMGVPPGAASPVRRSRPS